MQGDEFWARLREGKVVLGACVMYPAPGIIEGMCEGWDWLWIDMQHGQYDYGTVLHAVRTASSVGIAPIVRPATHDYGLLGKCADTAPTGLMVPMVNTPEEAQQIVNALRFPPLGMRSYGGRRPIDLCGRGYYQESELLVMLQIETEQAARNAECIIGTDGVDALFFGADDIRVRLGLPINIPVVESKELQRPMAKMADAARKAGKFCGCVAADPATLRVALDMGYQIVVGGGDVGFLRTVAAAKLEELRQVVGGGKS